MAVIKCKMCGGDLVLVEGQSVAECEYCGSRQTVPTADNEKKLTLFARANRLRTACEFDKAAGIYESIVADFPEEAEAYWGLVLCKYGIEYVDDPASGKKIPTCHRSGFDSVMSDSDFEQAQENADAVARKVYRDEAKQIEEIRKGIIEVSAKEEPYDIFICYKETAENGDRTLDSVLAQDIYDALTDRGYRTFFARITLEDKLGQEYEPYIFAALNSAKIMLAVGTDYEYYNAVWVKNEWSRFLKLMEKDKQKHLIPCFKNLDAYDMPAEFAKLQAQDLGKVGAMQDLLRGIEKLLPKKEETKVVIQQVENDASAPLLRRVFMFLEEEKWTDADTYCERVLDLNPECAAAYLGKLMAQLRVRTREQLGKGQTAISSNEYFRKALRYADPQMKQYLEDARKQIDERIETSRRATAYQKAEKAMRTAKTEHEFQAAAEQFDRLKNYKDSAEKKEKCLAEGKKIRQSDIYAKACGKLSVAKNQKETFHVRANAAEEAVAMFGTITDFMNAKELLATATRLVEEIKEQDREEKRQKAEAEAARKDRILEEAVAALTGVGLTVDACRRNINLLNSIAGWKNADEVAKSFRGKMTELEYEDLLQKAKEEKDVKQLKALAVGFDQLGDYRDSKNLAEHCRKRAADEQAKLDAEAEKQRLLEEQELVRRRKRKKTITIAAISVAAVVAVLIIAMCIVSAVKHAEYKEQLRQTYCSVLAGRVYEWRGSTLTFYDDSSVVYNYNQYTYRYLIDVEETDAGLKLNLTSTLATEEDTTMMYYKNDDYVVYYGQKYYPEDVVRAVSTQFEELLKTSIKEAHEYAEKNPVVEAYDRDLVNLCASYYPYCGKFEFSDNPGVYIESDFYKDGKEIFWICDQGDGVFMAELNKELHTYFQNPNCVSDMKVTEEFSTSKVDISFKNDIITYTWGYYEYIDTDNDGNVVNRGEYTEMLKKKLLPCE